LRIAVASVVTLEIRPGEWRFVGWAKTRISIFRRPDPQAPECGLAPQPMPRSQKARCRCGRRDTCSPINLSIQGCFAFALPPRTARTRHESPAIRPRRIRPFLHLRQNHPCTAQTLAKALYGASTKMNVNRRMARQHGAQACNFPIRV